jgi:3-methyladenine DNA glycosylase/8-oxoguanine DNA glycosylase
VIARELSSPTVGTHVLAVDGPLDLAGTLRPLGLAWAARDDAGWWRAMRTPEGPATILVRRAGESVAVDAWGEGADWAIDGAPELVGLHDDPTAWSPADPKLAALHRSAPGLRFGRTRLVFEAAMVAVIGQKVTGKEAAAGLRGMTRRFSGPAPGPNPRLRLPPDPERLAAAAYHDFHDLGVEKKRADTVRRLAADAARIDRLVSTPTIEAKRYLARFPGVGEWTVAETLVVSHGDTDAVSVGDYHTKNIVAWHLAGEERGTDERMLELLEPNRPHRARAVRLLEAQGPAPRRGPRLAVRGFERF